MLSLASVMSADVSWVNNLNGNIHIHNDLILKFVFYQREGLWVKNKKIQYYFKLIVLYFDLCREGSLKKLLHPLYK